MLQSPPNLFPDSSFRLQTLMNGRGYLSPAQASTFAPLQPSPGTLDPSQYRSFVCQHNTSQRLPQRLSLAIPLTDISFNAQPGFPSGHPLLPVRRTPLQPVVPLDSYSQTLLNLSQQSHHIPPQALQHPVGVNTLRQYAAGDGAGVSKVGTAIGGVVVDGRRSNTEESFTLHGLPGLFESREIPGKSPIPELTLSRSSDVHYLPSQSKHVLGGSGGASSSILEDSQAKVVPRQQPHLQPHQQQHMTQILSRSSTSLTRNNPSRTFSNNNNDDNNNNNDNDKDASLSIHLGCWKSSTTTGNRLTPPERRFSSFKDPNAVGIHHQYTDGAQLSRTSINRCASLATADSGASPETSASRSPASSYASVVRHNTTSSGGDGGYHRHFSRGSVIQLASGQLKRVEELRTEDFLDSCGISANLSVDTSRVTHVQVNHSTGTAVIGFAVGKKQIQVTVEAAVEHPFFVFNRGWSSCNPSRTSDRYGLICHQLSIGDICISLTHRYPPNSPHPPSNASSSSSFSSSSSSKRPTQSRGDEEPTAERATGFDLSPYHSLNLHISGCHDNKDDSPPPSKRLRKEVVKEPQRKRRWSAPDNTNIDYSTSPINPQL